MTSTALTVGQLSRRTGVPVKALREYTDWGLISNLGRNASNYRLYDSDAVWCVQTIRELRGLGLTLAEIREVARVAGEDCHAAGLWLANRLHDARARIERRIGELEQAARRIDQFEMTHQAELRGEILLWGDAPGATAA